MINTIQILVLQNKQGISVSADIYWLISVIGMSVYIFHIGASLLLILKKYFLEFLKHMLYMYPSHLVSLHKFRSA